MTLLPRSKVLIVLSTLVPGFRRVIIEQETLQEKRVAWDCIVRARDLRLFVKQEKPTTIWQHGEQVKLCYTPGCNNLVCADAACDICDDCLSEYRVEQIRWWGDAEWLERFKTARTAANAAYRDAMMGAAGCEGAYDVYRNTFDAAMEGVAG